MGAHLIAGEFQSDKYPSTSRGKVPLSVKDKTAQDLLWQYAQRRHAVDAEFSDDLQTALRNAGFEPTPEGWCSDMEAAPKDGRPVLATFKGQFDWVKFVAYATPNGVSAPGYAAPTHWMHLPADPPEPTT